MAERVKAAGVKLVVQVQSVQQAVEAVSMGADAIVAQVCSHTLACDVARLQSELCRDLVGLQICALLSAQLTVEH